MAKSFGEALATGTPVVLTGGPKPQVICPPDKKAEALDLLVKMGIVELTHPVHKVTRVRRKVDGTFEEF